MTRLLRPIAALTMGLLLMALPVHAQDGGTRISFQVVAFSLDAALGSSVSAQQIPARAGRGLTLPEVRHLVLSVSDVTSEGRPVPGPFRAPGVVRVYRTADVEGEESAAGQLEQLRSILAERPDLGSFMTVVPRSEVNPLPFLPVPQVTQVLRARAQYVDTPELAGISYVAGFRGEMSRFATDDFVYTFQGISA